MAGHGMLLFLFMTAAVLTLALLGYVDVRICVKNPCMSRLISVL